MSKKVTVPAILREADEYLSDRRRWTGKGWFGFVRKHRHKERISGSLSDFKALLAENPDAKPCVCAQGAVFLAAAKLDADDATTYKALTRLNRAARVLYDVSNVTELNDGPVEARVPRAAIKGRYNRVRLVFGKALGN